MIGGVSMKEIIYNDDNLLESDITEVVVNSVRSNFLDFFMLFSPLKIDFIMDIL